MTVTTDHAYVSIHADKRVVEPKLVQSVHHLHDEGSGHDDRPHDIVWQVDGLESGQYVKVKLTRIPELENDPAHDEVLHTLFGEGTGGGRAVRSEWTISYGTDSVSSGTAWHGTRLPEAITVQYDVELWGPNGKIATLDPDIRVIPDP